MYVGTYVYVCVYIDILSLNKYLSFETYISSLDRNISQDVTLLPFAKVSIPYHKKIIKILSHGPI